MNNDLKVPFLNLDLNKSSVRAAIDEVLKNGQLFNGKFTSKFSDAFSTYLNIQHFIGCANCTDAIEIILRAHDFGKNATIAVPAFSWYSDASSVLLSGYTPVFIDTLEDSWEMDYELLSQCVEKNDIKAVIVPHLFGQVHSAIENIVQLCKANNILLIEDCAQAHGARYKGNMAGTFGDVGVFSFYPTKNLGAFGDAGGIVTNNGDRAALYRRWANHGQKERNKHIHLGRNSRFDELQAAILYGQLEELNDNNKKRFEFAEIYTKRLSHYDTLKLPILNSEHVYHQFCVQLNERDKLVSYLSEKGIETDIHYPSPIPQQAPFSDHNIPCKRAKRLSSRILSLPIHDNHMTRQIEYVADTITNYLD